MNRNGKHPLSQALFLLAALVCHCQTVAAQDLPSEQSVRAAMVFNFLKFSDFPPEASTSTTGIRLCYAVRDARQSEALHALAGRKVGGRKLLVTDFTAQSGDCQVLYVDTRRRWNTATEQNAVRHALTISDYPGFVRDGGMIEIDVQKDGIQFDINLVEARRAGFNFAPQMLRLARQIHE
ncbi:MAG: YfiR family protein [Gallionellaceae bacterium]|nr:YfiR family protein [Gallionellaceae bacterium]